MSTDSRNSIHISQTHLVNFFLIRVSVLFEMCQSKKYDLIFMDCQIPVLDGYGVTGQIRLIEHNNGTRTPIIAMAANAMVGDRKNVYLSE